MTGSEAITIVLVLSFITAIISGKLAGRYGYTFKYYFVTGFIASCGILGVIVKIIMDYLN